MLFHCIFIIFPCLFPPFSNGLDGFQAASAASAAVASAAVAVEDGKVDVSTCRVVAAGRMVGSTYRNDQNLFPPYGGCACGFVPWEDRPETQI